MKILTFDTEEWYIEKHFKGGRKEKYRQYDELLDWILNTLEKNNTKATFFCVGQLAVEFPDVLKKIANAGHEIGSHSNKHLWVNKMTRQEFAEDTRIAIGEIENLIGRKVKSFRAPAFSIGKNNDWAFDVLAENGSGQSRLRGISSFYFIHTCANKERSIYNKGISYLSSYTNG